MVSRWSGVLELFHRTQCPEMGCCKGASWVTTAEGIQGEWEERTVISQKCPGPLPNFQTWAGCRARTHWPKSWAGPGSEHPTAAWQLHMIMLLPILPKGPVAIYLVIGWGRELYLAGRETPAILMMILGAVSKRTLIPSDINSDWAFPTLE